MDENTVQAEESGGNETTGATEVNTEETSAEVTTPEASGDEGGGGEPDIETLKKAAAEFELYKASVEQERKSQKKAISSIQKEKDLLGNKLRAAERRERVKSETIQRLKQGYEREDPDVASRIESEDNAGELEYYRGANADMQRAAEVRAFQEEVFPLLEEMGVDPTDYRVVNAANGAGSREEAKRRVLEMGELIQKANKSVDVDALEEKITAKVEARIAEEAAEKRKKSGLDNYSSVVAPSGEAGTSIKELQKRFNRGEDVTPEERKRIKDYIGA